MFMVRALVVVPPPPEAAMVNCLVAPVPDGVMVTFVPATSSASVCAREALLKSEILEEVVDSVPPRVIDPVVVTVPVSVRPETVPAPETLVTVPPGGAFHVPSARRKFVVPPPLAGASPFKVLS